jgi:YidC/Oxa1 family membrane protein insertase
MGDQKNFILAIVLSLIVLIGWQKVFVEPQEEAQREAFERQQAAGDGTRNPNSNAPNKTATNSNAPKVAPTQTTSGKTKNACDPANLANAPRLQIRSPRLTGSISLIGSHFDDLSLNDYNETIKAESNNVGLLSNSCNTDGYYAEFGWVASQGVKTPQNNSLWTVNARTLSPTNPVTLSWDNGEGLVFKRDISLDDNYFFNIVDRVENSSDKNVLIAPYGVLVRKGEPDTTGMVILHEGFIGVFDDELIEETYNDVKDDVDQKYFSTGGWFGVTDKYWLTAIIPDQSIPYEAHFLRENSQYKANFIQNDFTNVSAGESFEVTTRFYAGAKEVNLIESYEEQYGIHLFGNSIDWGLLFFLTKPMFHALDWLNSIIGNFGLSILALTLIIKILLFRLANKSYVSMSRMKKLQPKMKKLQERYKDDKPKLQQEMMAMYKKENVNPMAGCLPILLQLPIFFALYKTLYVSIEMRHAPFFGWVKDLSAPDDLTFITGFGALPWDAPGFLLIGIWPIIMGLTMWLQQKLNPAPQDPIQAKVMSFLPILFTFILAPFAVGLVIYWTWNNLLSMLQQWIIMRKEGVGLND